MPRFLAALCLAATLAACGPGMGVRPLVSTATLESRAAQLGQHGDHAGAARTWEQAAARATADQHNRLWLAAAGEWLAAGDTAAAERSLAQLAEPLAAAESREKLRLQAELQISNHQPRRALAMLDAAGVRPDEAVLATRARASFALDDVSDAVGDLVARESLLSGSEQKLANQRLIIEEVAAAARRGVSLRPARGAGPLVAGWLELGGIEANAEAGGIGVGAQLQAWRSRYPAHPANSTLLPGMLDRYAISVQPSTRIALLLPLTGRAQAAGTAVQDGFLAAYYEQPGDARPTVRVYDVASTDVATVYRQAILEGAATIVGPLTRDGVSKVAAVANGSVTTLALNFLPEAALAPSRFYQFALSPEDEARQAAARALQDGHATGVALVPANEWGQRVLAAYNEALTAGGGRLVASDVYAPGTTDFRGIINALLQIHAVATGNDSRDESQRPMFTYRADAQFIFVAGQPIAGRLIRTQLRFNYASRLPVYSTSDVFEPGGRGNNDLDGVIFPDMPWVTAREGAAATVRELMTAAWPERAPADSRLYAFGYDAYAIVAELGRRRVPFSQPLQGLTGKLSLDAQGRIHRQLQLVQVQNGELQPAPAGVISTQ